VFRGELEDGEIKERDDFRFPLGISTDFAHMTIEDVLRADMLNSPDSSLTSSSSSSDYSISSSSNESPTEVTFPIFEMDDY
jgi:formylglycine-generating enzyme required for sulfatase activity